MSRVAKVPIELGGASVTLEDRILTVKGSKGVLRYTLDQCVRLDIQDKVLQVVPREDTAEADALAGTMRANIANGVVGVVHGFQKKLLLIGVGYRATVQGKALHLTLGFSHPVVYPIPDGITILIPVPTEIVIQGFDKQCVGQVAAEIRRYRPPEAYKGKGIRYADERIKLKETKKK